jgi:hypothetical protein
VPGLQVLLPGWWGPSAMELASSGLRYEPSGFPKWESAVLSYEPRSDLA